MKNKDFESIIKDLEKRNPGKNFYDFQDFGECQTKIDNDIIPKVEIVELPKKYYDKLIKLIKGEK
jgi:hypothetical protein